MKLELDNIDSEKCPVEKVLDFVKKNRIPLQVLDISFHKDNSVPNGSGKISYSVKADLEADGKEFEFIKLFQSEKD